LARQHADSTLRVLSMIKEKQMRSVRKLVLLAVMAIAAMAAIAPSAFAQSEAEPLAVAPLDLEVRSEPGNVHCPAVTPATPPVSGEFSTSGGCLVHGGSANAPAGHVTLTGHVGSFEAIDSQCAVEFDLRIQGNATGYLTHQELTGGSECTRRPCHYPNTPNPSFEPPATRTGTHNESRPWRAFGFEPSAGQKRIRTLFCVESRHTDSLEPPSGKRHCNIAIPFVEDANHRYTFTANDTPGSGAGTLANPRCEITGVFTTEATQPAGGEGTRTQVEVNHL
jgi:hypothetical protein